MQTIAEARSIAEAFVEARQKASAISSYPGTQPSNIADAIAIQDSAIPLFGDKVAGWKVGRINPPWLEKIGVNRLPGPIFSAAVQTASLETAPIGQIFKDGFGAAEAEFIFRIGKAPKAGQAEFSLDEVADLVDAVFIGIEIASSPFAGINSCGPLVTISDFGNNNGLILGAEITDWRDSGLNDWVVESSIDGQLIAQGQASAFPDGPLGSVRYLVENLLARGIAVTPGTLVSTGAVTGVHEITDGQYFEARFGTFGKIDCRIAYATA